VTEFAQTSQDSGLSTGLWETQAADVPGGPVNSREGLDSSRRILGGFLGTAMAVTQIAHFHGLLIS
jgi:hypothetical protein